MHDDGGPETLGVAMLLRVPKVEDAMFLSFFVGVFKICESVHIIHKSTVKRYCSREPKWKAMIFDSWLLAGQLLHSLSAQHSIRHGQLISQPGS